jgi:hypothetical protein
MQKMNCWEFKKCGRQPEGLQSEKLGVCPATISRKLDGIHDGVNGGRACWVIAGTLCEGKEQGTFALKEANCIKCDFYKTVSQEEFTNMVSAKKLLEKLHG